MEKKVIRAIEAKFKKFDLLDHEEDSRLFFLLKCLLLKYLVNNDRIDFLENQGSIRNVFTFDGILKSWDDQKNAQSLMTEDPDAIDDSQWQWIISFIEDFPLFEGTNPDIIAYIYEKILMKHYRKQHGVFYTPRQIALYMASYQDLIEGKAYTALDPACGSGALLSALYDHLFKKLADESQMEGAQIHRYLLTQVLNGCDQDALACLVTKLVLILKGSSFVAPTGILQGDFLLDQSPFGHDFDLIITNPPYVGHKEIDRDYMKQLKEKFASVYTDKSDLSYCFVYRGWQLLKENGLMVYITSRYFMEAYNGKKLRQFIAGHFEMLHLTDFNGHRVIKGVGVDPAIVVLAKKDHLAQSHQLVVKRFALPRDGSQIDDVVAALFINDAKLVESFSVRQIDLSHQCWRLYKPVTKSIIDKIEKRSSLALSDLAECFQGIITGCDKAFVFEKDQVPFDLTDQILLKPWLKSKDLKVGSLLPAQKLLIYTDQLDRLEHEPQLLEYLNAFKDRLSNRRECRTGIRPWYFLQWGRKRENFETTKIVFPYKASQNRFAVDHQGAYFSADIYGLKLIPLLKRNYHEDALTALLNSRVYDYYFKSFAKKLGNDLYEYYPNTVMQLKIPDFNPQQIIQIKEKTGILKGYSRNDSDEGISESLNHYLYQFFDLSDEEINEIER
ncbi:MAG: adenine-specific DNA-methyltransferase [Eubacteriaceae bacterium]|jgi:adenine-specific DNA-methyltransferase|nr:adenine-specific DNA-methyltransferase [Eubacteriaceae bacterium]MDN5307803.1 adenine-specific DNA-methyltransferase [Eubacteriaceae bacterium]